MSWCPTAGCGYVFVKPEDISEFMCEKCNNHYCMDCRTDMHVGKTCIEYKADVVNNTHSVNDDLAEALLRDVIKAKKCPKCKFWVEKSQGCMHMTCRCTH
jgi:hypothetical protein